MKVTIPEFRYREMQVKFGEVLGRDPKREPWKVGGMTIGEAWKGKIPISIPETLLSLGVARTEEEAEEFIVLVTSGTYLAAATHQLEPFDALMNATNLGFAIGLAAGKAQGPGTAN